MDLEAEYNNRARVPEHPGIIEGWRREAAAFRDAAGARFSTIAYGDRDRERIDLLAPPGATAPPTVLFIHGGYWQALDRSFFSHLAAGVNAHGVALAVAGYDLCPQAPLGFIVGQVRRAVLALHRGAGGRVVAAGHSAGGHLAACLLATDWREHDPALPADLVPAAFCLSGLFELEPLVPTSINAALKLDPWDARIWSPALWRPPAGRILDAVVGGEESSEYLRQSETISRVWGAAGVRTRCEIASGANHFTILAPLADPASAMTARLVHLAREHA